MDTNSFQFECSGQPKIYCDATVSLRPFGSFAEKVPKENGEGRTRIWYLPEKTELDILIEESLKLRRLVKQNKRKQAE